MNAQTVSVTVATGKTYDAREYLKRAGFAWNGTQWVFKGIFDVNTWTSTFAKIGWNTRRAAIACQSVTFEVRTIVL